MICQSIFVTQMLAGKNTRKGETDKTHTSLLLDNIQSNFNGSNTHGTMKIISRHGFELMRVDYSARSRGLICFFDFP